MPERERNNRGASKCFSAILSLFVTLVITAVVPGSSQADNVFASSCSLPHVSEAINSAVDGDTVVIPAGTCTWEGSLDISKGVNISGAGIDETVIIAGSSSGTNLIELHVGHNLPVRLSYMTLNGRGNGVYVDSLNQYRKNTSFRIDNMKFINCSRSIWLNGWIYGVIDHNIFVNGRSSDITVFGDSDNSWVRGGEEGTLAALYVEDNEFLYSGSTGGGHLITSNRGSRYVFRYNVLRTSSSGIPYDVVDVHGACSAPPRGSYMAEIYENDFYTEGGGYVGSLARIRGGRGVVFNNRLHGNQNGAELAKDIELTNYRSVPGYIDGSCSSPLKTVCQDNEGYPCLDQINDLYIWDNLVNGNKADVYVEESGEARTHVVQDRDFFNYAKPSYKPVQYPHPLTLDPLTPGISTSPPNPPSSLIIIPDSN